MSDLITIPGEDNFETTLTQSRNGVVGDVLVNDIPTSTIATGEKSYIVVNPGKSNMQVARVSGWTSTPSKKFVVDSITVDEGNATPYTQKSHAANSVVRFSNNYQFWKDIQTAVNSKADSSELGNFTFTGSQIKATGDMKFKDDNNVELTLSTLAAGNGADQKVAITTNDTTTGTLNDKLLVGSGLTKTTNNPGGAETMTLAPDTSILATKSDLSNISSLSIASDYPLGEPITDITKSCVFKETAPTFAQATTVQNIGETLVNTRVSFPAIGTGVAGNSLKLALAKNLIPTAFLRVRIETDNAGSPSGTLVDVNATKDIDPATLTTSLADTTVTFPGSFTVANGTKVHTVVSVVGDVVNMSNYYKLGYYTNNTTVSPISLYNGSSRSKNVSIYVTSTATVGANTSTSSETTSVGYRFSVQVNGTIKVNKDPACTATRCRLASDSGTVLETVSFSGNVATFTTQLTNGTFYKVESDNSGSSYTNTRRTGAFPYNTTNISILSRSVSNFTISDTSLADSILSIDIISVSVVNNNNFPYISSTLFHNTVLSLTDSDFAYKVGLYGIATDVGLVGSYPKLYIDGVVPNFTSLVGKDYYLDGTPGGISNTPGTMQVFIGKSKKANNIILGYKSDYGTVYGTTDTLVSGTSRSTGSTSYVKLKEHPITIPGKYTIQFTVTASSGTAYGQMYINGVAVGSEISAPPGTPTTGTNNIEVNAGDIITIYGKASSGYTCSISTALKCTKIYGVLPMYESSGY